MDASDASDASPDANLPAPTKETPPASSSKSAPAEADDDDTQEPAPRKASGLETVPGKGCSASPLPSRDAPWSAIALALGATILVGRRRRVTPRL